jgi:hypothetical protein
MQCVCLHVEFSVSDTGSSGAFTVLQLSVQCNPLQVMISSIHLQSTSSSVLATAAMILLLAAALLLRIVSMYTTSSSERREGYPEHASHSDMC